MSVVGSDVPAWARAHQASFELTPLLESRQGKKIQVGVTLTLYALLPMEKDVGKERQSAAGEVWEGLHEIAQTLKPKEGSRARLEVEHPRFAAILRPENELKPEISLSARFFHGDDTFAEVTAEERDKLSLVTKHLTELGLKQGHW